MDSKIGDRHENVEATYAWVRLAVSLALSAVGGAGMWAVVVVLPAIQNEFGVERADASLPYTATMLGFAAGNLIVGRAIDRIGYFIPALAASVLLSAGFALGSLANSLAVFALVQGFMIGGGSSAVFGPLMADISHWFGRRRGVAVACVASGNYLAGAVWPFLIAPMMASWGWRGAYLAIGAICFACMVPLALLLQRRAPAPDAHAAPRSATAASSKLSPTMLQALLVVAGLGCCVAMSMPQVHIVAYCMDLGYGVARGTELLSIMLAAGVVSRLASGFIADRIGGVPTLLIGSVAQALSLVLYIPFDGLASLYVVSLVFGLAQGGIVPTYAVVVRELMPAAEAGRRVGTVIMATTLGMALGGWMSGWIYDQTGSYAAAFANGIGWNILNIAALLLVLRASRPGRLALS